MFEGWVVGGEVAEEKHGGKKGMGDSYRAVGNEGGGANWYCVNEGAGCVLNGSDWSERNERDFADALRLRTSARTATIF